LIHVDFSPAAKAADDRLDAQQRNEAVKLRAGANRPRPAAAARMNGQIVSPRRQHAAADATPMVELPIAAGPARHDENAFSMHG